MRLHSHESRQIQAMRGDIIPTGLKIWADIGRHAIFVVEFQPPQIPPPDYLRKTRNSYLLKFASHHIPDSFESAYLPQTHTPSHSVDEFWNDWPPNVQRNMPFRTNPAPITRTSTVSPDSLRCVDVEASNGIVKMYVNPRNSELWQKDMTTTLMQRPSWRIFALRKHRLPLPEIALRNQFPQHMNRLPRCNPTIREVLHQNPAIRLYRHKWKNTDKNLLMICRIYVHPSDARM